MCLCAPFSMQAHGQNRLKGLAIDIESAAAAALVSWGTPRFGSAGLGFGVGRPCLVLRTE